MLAWQQILTHWTPERLERLIVELAGRRPPDDRAGVDVGSIVAHMSAGYDLGAGAERSRAHRRIVEMIQSHVGQIEGMTYIQAKD